MVIELFPINRDIWKCNRRIIIDEIYLKRKKKKFYYYKLVDVINFPIFMIISEFDFVSRDSNKQSFSHINCFAKNHTSNLDQDFW